MKSIKHSNIIRLILYLVSILMIAGCEKFVEVDPPVTFVTSESAFSSNQTAIAELNGLYYNLSSENFGYRSHLGGLTLSIYGGLGADELKVFDVGGFNNVVQQAFYKNELTADVGPETIWNFGYTHLFQINTILEGLEKAVTSEKDPQSKLSPGVKKQLLGEARFMRAFIYFYLVNCFGDVPLITTTDYKINNLMPRTNKNLVYAQIEKDLLEAKEFLNSSYVNADVVTSSATSERTRPIKSTAAALLSRVYLYMGKYAEAEVQANLVISNTALYSLVAPEAIFLKNSREAIFALQPVAVGYQSNYGRMFLLPSNGPTSEFNPYYLNENLVMSFETGDPRLTNWISSVAVGAVVYYYPTKYRYGRDYDALINPTTKTQNMLEYNMVLRLAEQYLIRAEARVRTNNLIGAIDDINAVRTRARNGAPSTVLPNLSATLNQNQILDAISKERRHELFTEWGDRWFDLRRTGRLDAVMTIMTPIKSNKDWKPDQAFYPLSREILRVNPSLTQNKGY